MDMPSPFCQTQHFQLALTCACVRARTHTRTHARTHAHPARRTLDTEVRVEATGKVCRDDKDRAFGRETRSLKACYELMQAGFTDVVHMQGGLGEWRYQGLALKGSAVE
jgi:hypothetical protein